jgi:flagellin
MGFRINTNIGAMDAHRNATMNNIQLDKSLNRLSSGLRINRAADDSAGLAIADKLSAQSQGLGQAMRNANDAIGLIQTADGALQEYTQIAQRIRTLAVQAANDTQDTASRSYIQTEINRLISSASFINTQTKFNGKTIFTDSSFTFHVGAYSNEVTKTTIDSMTAGSVLGSASVSTQSAAEKTISAMDGALKTIDTLRSKLGAAQNQLESTVRNNSVAQVNISAAESQIRDVDFAAESANFNKRNILAQSGSYAMSQANAVQQNVLRLLQ